MFSASYIIALLSNVYTSIIGSILNLFIVTLDHNCLIPKIIIPVRALLNCVVFWGVWGVFFG